MKKLMTILAAGAFALLVSSCGGNSPEGVVKKAIDAVLDGDGDTYVELIEIFDEGEWDGTEKQREKQMAKAARAIEKAAKKMAKADDDEQVDDYEIIDVSVDNDDEDKAEVEVKFTMKNGDTDKKTVRVVRNTDGKWLLRGYGIGF